MFENSVLFLDCSLCGLLISSMCCRSVSFGLLCFKINCLLCLKINSLKFCYSLYVLILLWRGEKLYCIVFAHLGKSLECRAILLFVHNVWRIFWLMLVELAFTNAFGFQNQLYHSLISHYTMMQPVELKLLVKLFWYLFLRQKTF